MNIWDRTWEYNNPRWEILKKLWTYLDNMDVVSHEMRFVNLGKPTILLFSTSKP